MKANYIPLDKQSKKVQRAAARAHRTLWQGVVFARALCAKTDYRRKGRRRAELPEYWQ